MHIRSSMIHKFHFLQILSMNWASAIGDEPADAALTEEGCILFKDKTSHLEITIIRDDVIELDLCLFAPNLSNEKTCRHHIAQDEKAEQIVAGHAFVRGDDFQDIVSVEFHKGIQVFAFR